MLPLQLAAAQPRAHRRTVLAQLAAHLHTSLATAAAAATPPLATIPLLAPLEDSSPEGIVHALKTVGCALVKGVTAPADAARLAELLASYAPGGDVVRGPAPSIGTLGHCTFFSSLLGRKGEGGGVIC